MLSAAPGNRDGNEAAGTELVLAVFRRMSSNPNVYAWSFTSGVNDPHPERIYRNAVRTSRMYSPSNIVIVVQQQRAKNTVLTMYDLGGDDG